MTIAMTIAGSTRARMQRNPRSMPASARGKARGVMLLEALIGILVFSCGVLGLVAMHAAAIGQATGARERAQASYFANQLIAQMWADNRTNLASYSSYPTAGAAGTTCAFSGSATTNANAVSWLQALRAASTGLPGAVALDNHTQIAVAANTPTAGDTQVTVTICWRAPDETGWHSYTDVATLSS